MGSGSLSDSGTSTSIGQELNSTRAHQVSKRRSQNKKDTSPPARVAQDGAVRTPGARGAALSGLWRGILTVFILFHLLAIGLWTIPSQAAPLVAIRQMVRPYMLWTGLFQSWDMFAPNPKPENSYIKAVVITQNRHSHVWIFPRMEQLSLGERYSKERYRKFTEVLPEQKNQPVWPDVAAHVARMFNSPSDPPDKVLLIQFHTDIRPGADESYDPIPTPNAFYDEYVQPGDLR